MWSYLIFCLINLYKYNFFSIYNKYIRFFNSSKINLNDKTNKDVKYTIKYKKEYKLTPFQRQALVGIILGDGYLERIKSSYNTRLRIEQSYPEKKEYLNNLYSLFKPLVTMDPVILTRKPDKRTGKIYKSIYFRTLTLPCLNEYHDIFYKNKVKIIPKNLDELLTPIGLAYLIMDDGSITTHKQTVLHTRSFSKKEVLFIMEILKKNFSLETRIEEKKKDQWIIYIPVKQKIKLKDIVGPYIHESMLYKIQ